MSKEEGVEKSRVRKRIEKYFAGKSGFDLGAFGKYEKIRLGGGTWAYIVEVTLADERTYYAVVPVAQAYPLGIVVLHSGHYAKVVETLIDGPTKDF